MKTLLVLAQHPDLAEALRAGLNPEQYRILLRSSVDEAEPLLASGLANACIVDVELSSVQDVWFFEKLHRRAPKIPIIIYAGAKQWEWEEEAYLHGATYVLTKPVRIRMLSALLDRLWQGPGSVPRHLPTPGTGTELIAKPPEAPAAPVTPSATSQALSVLRDFSAILTHSLNA